jgi:hypothetical protein
MGIVRSSELKKDAEESDFFETMGKRACDPEQLDEQSPACSRMARLAHGGRKHGQLSSSRRLVDEHCLVHYKFEHNSFLVMAEAAAEIDSSKVRSG